ELGMQPMAIGPRPTVPGAGGGLGAEGAAAFDAYVQRKAKEIGLDLSALPEPAPNAGPGGGGGAGGGAGAPAAAPAGGATTPPANPMAPADWNPRFVRGRTPRAFDFVQSQRRRYALITKWAEFMKDLDMFIAAPTADVGANAQTGHPCVVFPYKFDVPQQGGGGGGGGGAGAANQQPRLELKAQPICAVVVGTLFNDDKILALAHQYQAHSDIHLKRPTL
ncbi:MAG: hypothetical protein ACT4P6_11330, partial [Gemmatimonadaceae bacterium]